jgi:hypothetical protein
MAIPAAIGAIASSLARAVPMVAQGAARFASATARGAGAAFRSPGTAARPGNLSTRGANLDNRAFGGINNSFQLLGKNIKTLQPLFQRLLKSFQFMAKSFRSLQLNFTASSSSINSLSASLIGIIPIIGKTAKKFVLFAENIADTIVNIFTGIPNFIESKFSGIISLIKSYSPAQAKQIEVALGRLRATIGEVLVPLAPMIRNFILNIARFIKDNASKIDIKKVFKWIVFFMFLAVGVVIAGVKFLMKQLDKIRALMNIGYEIKDRLTLGPQRRMLKSAWEIGKSFVSSLFGGKKEGENANQVQQRRAGEGDFYHDAGAGGSFDSNWEGLSSPKQIPTAQQSQQPQSASGQGKASQKKDPYSPERMMQSVASFFRGIPGMGDFAAVMNEMSNMFEKLFETPDTRGLPFEATPSTATSVEDIGKQAREAALGVNKKPEEETAKATGETSKNTEDIRQGVRGLVSALPQRNVDDLVREARLHIKAIRALDKNNMMALDADRQEQALVINGMEAMAERQEKANELLMRIVDNQRLIAEMERSKNYSFGRLNNQRA